MMLRPVPSQVTAPINVILITLRRTPDRTEKALARAAALGISPIVLWASDGRDEEAAASMPRDPQCHRLGHMMQPGEVGCCMSWWRAAAMIVANGWDRAIVVEDDFTPTGTMQPVISALDELKEFDLALLHNQKMPDPTIENSGHTKSFFRVRHSSWTTVAVCISNAGARKMLRLMPPFDRPVDVWIRDNEHGLRIYQPRVGWFRQDQWNPSTIRDNHNAGKIPRILHRIWVGGNAIPQEFEGYWSRWQELHPGWSFQTWGDAEIDRAFPNHKAIRAARALDAKIRNAAVSDVARLLILESQGGMYVDTDFEPVKNFELLLDSASVLLVDMTDGEPGHDPCNGIMASFPGHLFIQQAADKATKNLLAGSGGLLEMAGPAMIKSVLAPWLPGWPKPLIDGDGIVAVAIGDTGITVAKPWTCFPYTWTQERPKSYGKAWAAHHWARSWWGEKEWAQHRAHIEQLARFK